MCNACGNPAVPGHWTEAGASTPSDRLRARFRRAQILQTVLKSYGLTAHDGGIVDGIQLSTLSGSSVMVENLTALWVEAARLAGTPIDPLDARFLTDD
ncbi:MAG: hypothetical protein V4712_10910 [Pseudomonadota bacterium]